MVGASVLFVIAASTALQGGPTDKVYEQAINKWRDDYATGLQRPEGWLSVAGLFWLKPGANLIGSGPGSQVALPPHSSPPIAGTLTLKDGSVVLNAMAGVDLKVNDHLATRDQVLKTDGKGAPDRLKLGSVTFKVIERGDKVGVRLYDPKGKGRTSYKGLHWYPIDPSMQVVGTFVPYNPPKSATITNVLGQTTPVSIPGYLTFKIGDTEYRLDAEDEGDVYFLNFTDKTTGKTTYPAGRFLYVPKASDGLFVIDFNKATCPPCAYTDFATCPLPPAGNRLDVEVKAGEKKYHG